MYNLTNFMREFTLITYIDLALSLVLVIAFVIIMNKFTKNNVMTYVITGIFVLKVIASVFLFEYTSDILSLLLFAIIAAVCVIYAQEIQRQLNSTLTKLKSHEVKTNQQVNLIKELHDAVKILSAEKTGAIITIERKDSLEHYIRSGDAVEAPVTAAMLCTIFYKGTPLHDGALIIRGVTIKAASVFFTPSVKALAGNYGARHRASLGISEVCDAVTIVVSEQTGRISIAYSGELISVSRDNFDKVLADYLNNA